MSAKKTSSSPKACCFCNLADDNELEYGKIYEHNGIVTHYYCLLLSSNMEQKGQDNEGILGFLTEDIQKELRRGKRLVCTYCRKSGATLGCCNVKCKRIFHFPCGLKAGSLHQFFGEFKSYCINHKPKQNIDQHILKEISSIDNLLCYICYDKVNPSDHVETLWAPCCKKDAWFHRKCVQQLAMSAGYFFKCPLCNNKKEFQKVMQENGIFVPSQDASWELVPNAFEELLYRHDQCDAVLCLCPKGRKYTSSNAKWELVLCRTCGSQGIHMSCGQLKWANPVWDCVECTSILGKAIKDKENVRSSSSNGSSLREFDSDSDTDISVGTEFPLQYASPNFDLSPSSSSSSLPDIMSNIKLRPGPRSFKLQQQIKAQQISKQIVELKYFDLKRNETDTNNAKYKDNSLVKNDTVKIKSLTSKESSSQERREENDTQKNDKQTDCREERKSSVSNNNDEKLMEKKADIIIIESDDDNDGGDDDNNNDDDDDVKIILSKQTMSQTPLQRSNKPLGLITDKSVLPEDSNVAFPKMESIDRQNADASESEIASKNTSVIVRQSSAASPRESTANSLSLNSEDADADVDTVDINGSPIMSIKITNVTSVLPEVFESTPDIICEDDALKNSVNSVSALKRKVFEEYVRSMMPLKRSVPEASNVADNGHKKIKRDKFCENYTTHGCMKPYATAPDTSARQNRGTSPIKPDEISKAAEDPSKCMSADGSFNSSLNVSRKKDYKDTSSKTCEISASSLNDAQRNDPSLSLHQMSNNCTDQVKSRHSVEGSTLCNVQSKQENSLRETANTHLHFNECNSQLDSTSNLNSTNNQDTSNNEANAVCAAPLSSLTLPERLQTLNNITGINNNQTVFKNQDITIRAVNPTTCAGNNNRTGVSNKHKIVTSAREKSNAKVSSLKYPGHESPNKCDGDAGTSRAETRSTGQRKRHFPSDHSGKNGAIGYPQSLATTRSVFLHVTSNHNTCHQPRLIPQYMDLNNLKFRACESDNVQMILYDTFSVNISMKNPKESRKRLESLAPPKEYTFIPRRRDETSSSKDYIADERIDKFYCTLKSETHLINDKTKCITRSRDDAKENLDPIKSRTLSRNDVFSNSTLMNNTDDAVTPSDYICENDNEMMRFVSSDTNVSTFTRRICNMNIDNIADNIEFVRNDCNQLSRINFEDVQQQVAASNVISESKEEKTSNDRFSEEIDKVERSINSDLNIVSRNKSVEKVLQDNITFFVNKHVDDDRELRYDSVDDASVLSNDKCLSRMNVVRLKAQNRRSARVANITYNEHNILNKQIDTYNADGFIQCRTFYENTANHKSESNAKRSIKSCFKISIDLCKIQNLLDTRPELFTNQDCNDNHWRKSSLCS
ncbi:dentin sialophosphoprotein isoform X2 [Ooceraea biroi]|nr:dentin sialophosphoprotein isoform X2 [Ooceraea biroi]